MRFHSAILFSAWLILLLTSVPESAAGEVTIYRDRWGVPHIYAKTSAEGAFGLGYAQAEDRLDDIHISVRTGLGTMAEAFGDRFVENDYLMRLCRNAELAEASWEATPGHLRELAINFTHGIAAYSAAHPEDVPAHAVALEPWMLQAVGRAMVLRWPLGTIKDDLGNGGGDRPRPPTQSNEWAVAPARSADNVAILLADPHLTWEGLAVMYEARVHAGDLHMNGFFLIGSPIMGIGHNRHVGWALTTGGPDTADVYEMKVRQNPELQYEYDGEWRSVETSGCSIPVKDGAPVERTLLFTHLGPLVAPPDLERGVAYVGAAPLLERTGMFDQFHRMSLAKNVREFYEAIGMGEFNEQNIMFADVHGEIGYVRTGATPIRPDGYDWSNPVPGNTSATAWKGIHSIDDLVQIFNPAQGYMQNCNISPANMMVDSPLRAENYKDYIFNVSWDKDNPRSKRIRQLLHADASVTRAEAIAYAMDVRDYNAQRWQQELQLAVDAAGARIQGTELAAAVEAILAWDGRFTPDAQATSLYKFWRMRCGEQLDLTPMLAGHLDPDGQAQLLGLLQKTITEMESRYGRWDIPWGDIHKVGRGGKYYPVGGTDFRSGNKEANFSETLFDVRSQEDPDRPGHFIANSGSMAMVLMFFHSDGIESHTCVPWGQSGHVESPHFMDQGEKLYSQRKMKPTWWQESDLRDNVESTRVLEIP